MGRMDVMRTPSANPDSVKKNHTCPFKNERFKTRREKRLARAAHAANAANAAIAALTAGAARIVADAAAIDPGVAM